MSCGKGLMLIALCAFQAEGSAMERCSPYSRESTSTCSTSYTRITTAADCNEAALSLDLPASASLTLSNKNILPMGCYFMISTRQLYFNPVGSDTANDADRVSICANEECKSHVSSARQLQFTPWWNLTNGTNSTNSTMPPIDEWVQEPECASTDDVPAKNRWCSKKCDQRTWKQKKCSRKCAEKCNMVCECNERCMDDRSWRYIERVDYGFGYFGRKERSCNWVAHKRGKRCKLRGKTSGSNRKVKAKNACPTACKKKECKGRRLISTEFV